MLANIAEAFGMERKQICMVGDRLDTDILFGQDGGLSTMLVLSGTLPHAPGLLLSAQVPVLMSQGTDSNSGLLLGSEASLIALQGLDCSPSLVSPHDTSPPSQAALLFIHAETTILQTPLHIGCLKSCVSAAALVETPIAHVMFSHSVPMHMQSTYRSCILSLQIWCHETGLSLSTVSGSYWRALLAAVLSL